jgi:hypothetical protein
MAPPMVPERRMGAAAGAGRRGLFFSAIAPNFFTLGNFFEITRFSSNSGCSRRSRRSSSRDRSVGRLDERGSPPSRSGRLQLASGGAAGRRAILASSAGGALNALLIASCGCRR